MKHYKNSICLQECENLDCPKNQKHLDERTEAEYELPIKFVIMDGCKKRIKPKEANK